MQAVQKVGGSVHWTSCDQVDKELIYVLGNFDCLPYKKVAGIARYVMGSEQEPSMLWVCLVGVVVILTVYYVSE